MEIIKNILSKGVVTSGLVALFLQGTVAHAVTTISFDRLPTTSDTGALFYSVVDSGFTVKTERAPFFISTGRADDCIPECAETDSQYLRPQVGNEAISVYKNEAGLFNLHSFEYSETHVDGEYPAQIHVTGHVWDGSVVTATFLFDGVNDGSGPLNDFQTAVLPDSFINLTSIDFKSDTYGDRYGLDTIVTVELDAGVISPTACEQTYPVTSATSTGGGQSAAVNEQIQVMFSGHLMTQAGLISGGKNAVTICPGSRVGYEVIAYDAATNCSINGATAPLTGKLLEGHQLICNNKPVGSDADRFTVKAGR